MDMDSGGRMIAATLSTGSSSGSGVIGGKFSDHFPAGLRVLVVDDDPTCLMILEKMLDYCNYQVTTCSKAAAALSLLRKKKDGFDLVLSDVYMPDMDGFKLLEHIGLEMNLPVIMMSADDTFDVVRKGVTHGACDYLIKPVRMEAIKNIWQHVVRKRKNELKELEHSGSVEETDKQKRLLDDADYASSAVEGGWRHSKRRKDGKVEEDEGENREDTSAVKKPRVVWSVELHQQFVAAVNQLGIDKAVPKKILELMNVPGLTRENVASHLQKYRLYLRRVSETSQHPSKPNTSFMGAPEAPFGSIASLDGFDLQALEISNQLQPPNLVTLQTGLGRTPNGGMGMPLGCQMKLFNSDAQSADLSKMRSGLVQELGNTQLNLLHGLPTSIEPKQLVHFNQSVQPCGNMDLQVGEGNLGFLNSSASLVRIGSSRGAAADRGSHSSPLMMQIGQQREQLAVAQPQTQMQLHMSQQQQLRGQLLNKIASGQPSGLPTPLGEQMLPNEIAGPVVGRNGTVVAGYGNASPVGTCNSNLSYTAVSQTSSVDFPVSNSMELLGNRLPIAATAGITSLPKMCQEAMPAAGNLEGLDHTIGIKGSRSLVPSYDIFNEFYKSKNQNWRLQNVNNAYDSIRNTNSIRSNPGFGMGNQNFSTIQRNEKDRNACIGAKGLSTPSAKDENGNLGISMQTHSNNAVHNSFTVKVESGTNLICDTTLLEEQFIQDDIMNAIFKQQQEEIGLVDTDFNFDGGPMG